MARGAAKPDGSERTAPNGYHYTKVNGKWILTSRMIAEQQIIKRPLEPGERVVFKNNDRTDLRAENLQVVGPKTTKETLKRREANLIARIEELQGQLADVQEEIHELEITELPA